ERQEREEREEREEGDNHHEGVRRQLERPEVSGLVYPAEEVFGGGAHAALSVSQLTRHISGLLRADEILADVWVRGEVGNVSRPSSGHLYFALKDEGSCIGCAMWRSRAALLPFRLDDGAQIL